MLALIVEGLSHPHLAHFLSRSSLDYWGIFEVGQILLVVALYGDPVGQHLVLLALFLQYSLNGGKGTSQMKSVICENLILLLPWLMSWKSCESEAARKMVSCC